MPEGGDKLEGCVAKDLLGFKRFEALSGAPVIWGFNVTCIVAFQRDLIYLIGIYVAVPCKTFNILEKYV